MNGGSNGASRVPALLRLGWPARWLSPEHGGTCPLSPGNLCCIKFKDLNRVLSRCEPAPGAQAHSSWAHLACFEQ